MIQITNSLYAFEIAPPISNISLSYTEVKGAGRVYSFDCEKNGKEVSDVLCTVGYGKSCEYICLASELLDVNTEINMMYQESTELIVAMMEKVDLTKEYAIIRITN